MTGISVNRFKRLVICVALLASVSIPVIGVWRADQGFREVGRFDLVGRLNSLGSVELGKHINYDQTLLGREIYASSDPFMFMEPGVSQEPAKTKRLGNLKYMWLPKLLVPWKPVIHDGHLIVAEIRGDGGKPNQKNGVFVSFESITTGGDLYWRFRYPGVVVGGILFGCFYSFLCCVWVKYADLNGRVWQIILACIPATLLQGPPLRSLLETIWTFGYDFPKYILLVIVLSFVIERFLISQEQWR